MIPARTLSTNRPLESRAGDAAALPWAPDEWRRELARAVADVDELLAAVGVAREAVGSAVASDGDFPLKAPWPYIARMRHGDPNDPLLRQVLPTGLERQDAAGYRADALEEAGAMVDVGLMRKYAGRVLLIATGSCAVHCRFCFRRHFPYADHRQDSGFSALDAVRRDPGAEEVILSGGDPLLLTDRHLGRLVARIGEIGHVQRIRIHTRVPVVIPQRVTAALIDALASVRQRIVVVLHFKPPKRARRRLRPRPGRPRPLHPCSTKAYCCAASTTRPRC